MPRTPNKRAAPAESPEILPAVAERIEAAQDAAAASQEAARALAVQLAYDGAVTVGALEDEIRFYQRRSVEALLECGKRLLLLREMLPPGNSHSGKNTEFEARLELLGFSKSTAYRFMQAAAKTAKSATVAALANEVKSAKAFLELVTHDNEDDIKKIAELDAIDRMSAGELRTALREAQAEREATQEVLDKKNARIDKLEREKKLLSKLPPDERLQKLQTEAAAVMNDALGAIRGGLRGALVALGNAGEERGQHSVFMAGLVGQLVAELAELRVQFDLPDVSNAADLKLMAETAEWAGR